MLTARQREDIATQIDAMQATLRRSLAGHQSAAGTVKLDQASVGRLSRMDAMQAQAMAKASEQRTRLMLKRLESAKARLADGDFGLCIDCDEPIPYPRLHANPAVLRCVPRAAAREAD